MKLASYVNVYDECQVYGGPEEGGWFYTAGQAVRSRLVPRFIAKLVARRIRMRLDRNSESSGTGWWFPAWNGIGDPDAGATYDRGRRVYIESHPAEDFPSERPHYE